MFQPIYEIPIYRLSIEKRREETEYEKEKYFQNFKQNDEYNYRFREKTDQYFDQYQLKDRNYNEIIGYIKLHIDGRKIYGDIYFITSKRIRRNLKNKKIEYKGKIFERWVSNDMNNDQIFNEIIDTINYYGKKDYKKRFIDMRTLTTINQFINRRKICGFE